MSKSNQNKTFLVCLTLLLAIGLMPSCKTVNINSEAPEKVAPLAPNIPIPPSVINVPISFTVTQIESRINQELNGVIYKDDNIEDDNYMMTITKNGLIKVSADNDKITFSIPLHISVTGRWQWEPCSICPKISKTQSTAFDIIVTSSSSIALTENWQIKTQTTGDYSWGNQKPSLDIGPIKIPVSSVVDLALKPQMEKISARFDQEIQNRINIKDYVKKAWILAQQPIEVSKEYHTWLLITPTDISATPINAKSGIIRMTVGIKTVIETVSGDMPHPVVNNNLPRLSPHNGVNDDFNIGLSAEVSYAFASDILKKQVAGQNYNFDDHKYEMTVDSISLSGNADYILIKMDLSGQEVKGGKKKIKGTVYMQGIPYYDQSDMTIKVKDLAYSVKSKNVLVKSAGWLIKAGFEDKVRSYLVFPIKDRLDAAQKMIESSINNGYRINENAQLKGTISKIEPQGIYLTNQSMKAIVNAKGKITIIVDKL